MASVRTIELKPFEIHMRTMVSRTWLERLESEVSDHIEFRYKSELYGQELSSFSKAYPSDWMQAVKERWFPAWLLRRWPVQYSYINGSTNVVFPDWLPPPDMGRVAFLQIFDNRVGLYDYEDSEDKSHG